MVKHKDKYKASFNSIYGNSLMLNMSKSKGCLQVSIKNESNVEFFQINTAIIASICAIALLSSVLVINMYVIIIVLFLMLYILYKSFFVIEETFLIIKGLGCHISKKHWFGERTIFIPYEQIQKVFINEVIFRGRIIYLLTLLIKDWVNEENKHKLVPLFLNLLPKIDCLQIIYKNIKYLESR